MFAIRRKAKRRDGTTTVEFAVILPVMFLFIVGSIQLFRFYAVANSMELAVMEGARRGLLPNAQEADAIAATTNYLKIAGLKGPQVNAIRETNEFGQLELYISANLPMNGNGFLVLPGHTLTVLRECRIRCESSN